MATLKALNHKYCLNLGTCHNAVQFTDPNPTIYWYEKRGNLTLNIPVYNPIKAMSVFLTASETQCIIYRPELPNSQASRKSLKSS